MPGKTISELSAALYKALDEVQLAKSTLDKATEAAGTASTNYNNSVTKAMDLRATLDEEMNKIIPASPGNRVRMSA